MFKNILYTLGAVTAMASAWAQAPAQDEIVGSSIRVEGLVTVSQGARVTTAVDGAPMINGSRYVTSSSGEVTLRYRDGCEVKLEPNRWYEVNDRENCAARILAVHTVTDPAAAGLFAGGGAAGPVLLTVGAVILGGSLNVSNPPLSEPARR